MPSQIFTLSLRLAGLTKDPFVAFIIVIVTLLPLISSAFCRTFDVFQLEILLNELEKEPEEKYKNFLLKILFLISLSFCSNSGRKILIVNPNGRQTLARSSETRINSFWAEEGDFSRSCPSDLILLMRCICIHCTLGVHWKAGFLPGALWQLF